MNIGSSVVQRKPDFEFLNAGGLFTDTASEPFVWVVQSRKSSRRRKRGKRAGVLVRLRRRAFRPPLPTILLANVQSLDNKLCELRARISYQRETMDCCVICLTETWMSAMVPDSAIELTGFSVHRSDRTKELTGKSRGGGVCFYINNSWCNERNIHSIKSFCSPDLEFHTLLCRPFWLPREFTAIIITAVYIPPQANTDQALRELYGNISEQETTHPDAAFIGLLTQMQCWRRHISVSSSWGGWGSLERAPESSDPSTPALWRASWPTVSPPGLETAPLATAGLCKVSCKLPATLLEVSFPPSRISTPGGVQGKPGGLSKTPATRPTVCSLCCPQGDVSVASDPALADWGTAFSLRLSG